MGLSLGNERHSTPSGDKGWDQGEDPGAAAFGRLQGRELEGKAGKSTLVESRSQKSPDED